MNKPIVYTTIFGNYDTLKVQPKQSVDCDFICITDNPNLQCEGWQIVVQNQIPANVEHPRMKAKFFKIFPLFEFDTYAINIYIDATIQITSTDFVKYCLDTLGHTTIAVHLHPQRKTIQEEIAVSRTLKKYDSQPLELQAAEFIPEIDEYPLCACGVLVRKYFGNNNSEINNMRKAMNDWWFHNVVFSYQDQISFPYVCGNNNVQPVYFPHNQLKSPYFKVVWNTKKMHL